MNWYSFIKYAGHEYSCITTHNRFKIASQIIGYHATRALFNQFDLSFAKDELGMRMGEGLGHNKFYFAKDKSKANPQFQIGEKRKTRMVTAELHFNRAYNGNEYRKKLSE